MAAGVRYDADVAVIGSGFGGSVTALRAAQAGRQVLVLEQGRRLTPADLQRGSQRARHLLWEPRARLRGYLRQTVLGDVVIVGGVGVGGGSIVYAGVLLRPGADVFAQTPWRSTGIDWGADLDPHYRTAEAMLGRAVNPDHGLQDQWLAEAARLLGAGSTYGPTPQAIDFDSCIRCGQCLSGCPYGAKGTADRTYLAQAEALGVEVRPQSRVEMLVPLGAADGSSGWRLVLRDPLRPRSLPTSVTAREVVVAAGVLGTCELLLACRDRWGTMPALSAALGTSVRTNSEAFSAITHPPGTDVTHGAAISSEFYPDAATHITNNRFPRSYSFMKWYLSPTVDGTGAAQRRRQTLARIAGNPRAATRPILTRDWHKRTTVLTIMQAEDNRLQLVYRRRPWGWSLGSTREAGAEPAPAFLPQTDAAGRAVAAVSGGVAYTTLMESVLGISATAHILGGAVIAPDPASGVVDSDHRVFGYHGLRIMDGSVVPTNLGVNPSWTITALAERATQRWLG